MIVEKVGVNLFTGYLYFMDDIQRFARKNGYDYSVHVAGIHIANKLKPKQTAVSVKGKGVFYWFVFNNYIDGKRVLLCVYRSIE